MAENTRKSKEKSILVNPFVRFTKTTDFLLKLSVFLSAGVRKWAQAYAHDPDATPNTNVWRFSIEYGRESPRNRSGSSFAPMLE